MSYKGLASMLAGVAMSTAVGCSSTGRTCSQQYTTNTHNNITATDFSNRQIRGAQRRVVDLELPNSQNYTFGRIEENQEPIINEKYIPKENVFEYWAVREDELSTIINQKDRTARFGRHDNQVRLFIKNPEVEGLRTNMPYNTPTLKEGQRAGTLPISAFNIPTIRFTDGKEITEVAYAETIFNGEKVTALIKSPFHLELVGGRINFLGDNIYLETLGQLETIAQPAQEAPVSPLEAELIMRETPVCEPTE